MGRDIDDLRHPGWTQALPCADAGKGYDSEGICPTCGGSGYGVLRPSGAQFPCPTCHGTGRQSDAHSASEGVK